MPKRVDLGDDRWAQIATPKEMTHGTKMRVQELLSLYTDETLHPFVVQLRMRYQLVADVLLDWSLDLPLPKGDPAMLNEAPGDVTETLSDEVKEHMDCLDFNRAGSSSSRSETPSTDTTSQDKSHPSQP